MSVIQESDAQPVLVGFRPRPVPKATRVTVQCPVCKDFRTVTKYHATHVMGGLIGRCVPCGNKAERDSAHMNGHVLAYKACRHCNHDKVNRPRGLCWTCYYTPGIKELYPSQSKYARRGEGNFAGEAGVPEPTQALPGTVEKLLVLELRAKLKQCLFHPDDARGDDETQRETLDVCTARPCSLTKPEEGDPRIYVCALPYHGVQWEPGAGND